MYVTNVERVSIFFNDSEQTTAPENQTGNKENNSKNNQNDTTTEQNNSPNKDTIELERKSLLNDKISILIPKTFEIMSEELAKIKYPGEQRPALIYTNEEASINVAFNYTQIKIAANEIPEFKEAIVNSYNNSYPTAEWLQNDIIEINGKTVGVIELITPATDTDIYNLIFFTGVEEQLLFCTVNLTKNQMEEWQPIAKQIMNSLKTN